LGIFGVYVAVSKGSNSSNNDSNNDSNNIKEEMNEYGGYLLRVKPAESDEGGVAAGYAVLSCPALE